jgi:hypothetical protein
MLLKIPHSPPLILLMPVGGDSASRLYAASNSVTAALRVTEKTATPPPEKSVLDILFGRPLSYEEDTKERIGPAGAFLFLVLMP